MPSVGSLIIAAIVVPLLSAAFCFIVPRAARALTLTAALVLLVDVLALTRALVTEGASRYRLGGWGAPVGIELLTDGLSVFMLLSTALAGLAATLYALRYFPPQPRSTAGFWPLWLFLWGALNALFLSADLFNLYVTLELVGLAAVAMVALAGSADAITGAMRYLLTTIAASLTYLLGVALLYHHAPVLDMVSLGRMLEPGAATWIALALMVVALLVKSAVFPLHFWLPPAHASAPAPVSAVLSGLVVKATVYLLARLWLDVMPEGRRDLGTALAGLGAGAIIWGSIQALRQRELKLMVAYSTVAQVGYLLLPFAVKSAEAAAIAWRGALYFVVSHALAKGAMFMAVGNLARLEGSGSLDDLHLAARQRPMTVGAFGVAGVSIIGLPPSGGFLAKWLLLEASFAASQGWVVAVILLGGLLSAAYVFRVVGLAFIESDPTPEPRPAVDRLEWIALVVALSTVVLGFVAPVLLGLLEIDDPFARAAEVPS